MSAPLRYEIAKCLIAIFSFLCSAAFSTTAQAQEFHVDSARFFTQEVQPVLRRHCFRCHGTKNQEADLQLNLRASAMSVGHSEEPIVVAHDPDNSLLIQRLTDESLGDLMPLDGEPLDEDEISVLRTWIEAGAFWPDDLAEPKHWAYQPIQRPEVPAQQQDLAASLKPVDAFIEQRLLELRLTPNDEVDRARLIRRVSLALTGIPPTPEEVEAFEQDSSPKAYETLVDRLLASPRYGERWAVPWLDLARYADSNGFQADQIRDNWAYRDWVIRAMNDDMPFDQFVTEQLAGDLLPDATSAQKVATGFHRMTTCNVEAGVHPEANRVNQIVDRVNTTATVFLGTTMECAQCHDHKYDPFSQKDYYRLFAYFNNTPLEVENTSGVTWDFYGPMMDLPMDSAKEERLLSLKRRLAEQQAAQQQLSSDSDAEFQAWLEELQNTRTETVEWKILTPVEFKTTGGEDFEIQSDGAVLLSGEVPDTVEHSFVFELPGEAMTAIRVEALTDESIPGKGPGRGDPKRTNFILSEIQSQILTDKEATPLQFVDTHADFSQTNWPVKNAIDGDRKTGWAISPQFGKSHWASFVLDEPYQPREAHEQLQVKLLQYYGSGRVLGKPRISVYFGDPKRLSMSKELLALAQKDKWTGKERKKLRAEFDRHNPRLKAIESEIKKLERQIAELKPDTTLVMVEMEKPRETFVMIRGEYENLGEKVDCGTPEILPDAPTEQTGDRLELARWLTRRDNPLLARVTVNRWWGELFGTGLVSTPEDFGTQGEMPTHPELLDWLAAELMESGWSMKRMHKLMVMSQAFRRSARMTSKQLAADPQNRWLARGPRFRMPAELIRDNGLAMAGLLSDSMYGTPVMPYQPDNIWRSVGRNQPKWKAAEDQNRFRRGIYIVWKRAAPYPSFVNFDAPNRGSCTVSRGRSNTPLQALTLLNDPAFAEMALAMADRILIEQENASDEERLRFAMRLAVARSATSQEIAILQGLLDQERELLEQQPKLVDERTKVPFSSFKLEAEPKELAAWLAVTNAILNLDETVSQ